jgi:hypothetical protein
LLPHAARRPHAHAVSSHRCVDCSETDRRGGAAARLRPRPQPQAVHAAAAAHARRQRRGAPCGRASRCVGATLTVARSTPASGSWPLRHAAGGSLRALCCGRTRTHASASRSRSLEQRHARHSRRRRKLLDATDTSAVGVCRPRAQSPPAARAHAHLSVTPASPRAPDTTQSADGSAGAPRVRPHASRHAFARVLRVRAHARPTAPRYSCSARAKLGVRTGSGGQGSGGAASSMASARYPGKTVQGQMTAGA